MEYEKSARSSKELEEIVSEIDLNNDGKIDINEFIEHITKAVEKVKTKTGSNLGFNGLSASKESASESKNRVGNTICQSEKSSDW